ncbi:hypothetical protein C3495_06270 [Clostridiaceae bacterium 14S0207]|nr:hypothetical protein C3495_06270 [Clostridiaceae bacterium 14S0207]
MRIGKILEVQQPKEYRNLNKNKKQNKKKKDKRGQNLSFSDYVEMMKHDSYKRCRGRLRQK